MHARRPVDLGQRRRGARAAATQSTTAVGVELADLLESTPACRLRRGRPPSRREAPEHVGRADDVPGGRQPRGDGPDVVADAEDLLDHQRSRAGPGRGVQTWMVHVPPVATAPDSSVASSSAARSWHTSACVRSLSRRAPVRLRLRAAATSAIAQTPIEPRDAARLLVDRGQAAPNTATWPTCPTLLARRRPARGQRDQGAPGPAARCAGRPGGAAEVLLLEPLDGDRRTWEALVRPARKLRAGRVLLVRRRRAVVAIGARTGGRRHVPRSELLATTTRSTSCDDATARCRCRRTSHTPLGRPRPLPDRVRRASPARRPRRPPGCTSRPSCSAGSRRRACESRRSSSSSASTRSSRSPPTTRSSTAMHTERYRVPAGDAGRRARAAERVVAVGTTTVRALECAAATRGARGRTDLFIHRGFDVPGRRPAADQLPPAAHDAADDDRRVRRAALAARSTPRRWPTATGSCRSATPCCSTARATEVPTPMRSRRRAPVDRVDRHRRRRPAGVGHDGARHATDAVLHAGRHPRRDQVPQRRRLRAPRRRDRARQHVPPDAAPGRRRRRPLRWARPVRRVARPDAHRLRRVPGVLARAEGRRRRRDVPQHLRRVDASIHARSRPSPSRSCSAPTSRWCSTSARRCRRRPRSFALAVERTAAWAARARAAHTPRDQALFGIVQGGIDEVLRAESADAPSALDFDGYGIGGLSVGETRDEMLPALAAALDAPAGRPPALPDGRRRPGVAGRGGRPRRRPVRLVMQTRLGRHGTALTTAGSVNVKAAATADDDPIDPTCGCEVCARHTAATSATCSRSASRPHPAC